MSEKPNSSVIDSFVRKEGNRLIGKPVETIVRAFFHYYIDKEVKYIEQLQAQLAEYRWIDISEEPKNDTYYIALIGPTGDDFGNTLEWLRYNEMWFYAKSGKHYPRSMFIRQYMKFSLPITLPEP